MRIFVAGATGVLGKRAVKALTESGHDVTAVARSDEKAALVRSLGATPVSLDVFDAGAVKAAAAGHDVVMNLATHIPNPSKSAFPGAWKENDRLRVEGSRNLVDAAIATGASRYVQESIAFFYPDSGDRWIDESAPIDLPDYAASTAEAERQAQRATDNGLAGVALRFGMFYAPDTKHTKLQMRLARMGMSPFIGPADAYQPLIQVDDGGRAVAAAMNVPAGIYNVVDTPLTRAEAAQILADALGKKKLRSTPRAAIKMGGPAFKHLARSVRASNKKFVDASGFAYIYPSFREGVETLK